MRPVVIQDLHHSNLSAWHTVTVAGYDAYLSYFMFIITDSPSCCICAGFCQVFRSCICPTRQGCCTRPHVCWEHSASCLLHRGWISANLSREYRCVVFMIGAGLVFSYQVCGHSSMKLVSTAELCHELN
jgi:hypothetical protein